MGTDSRSRALNHFDAAGNAWMVDVSAKMPTTREAVASGTVTLSPDCFQLVQNGKIGKGDVLGVARIAGILAAKKVDQLIPLTHTIPLEKAEILFDFDRQLSTIIITGTVGTSGKTGVEMEALTAVSIAALTIYDMCKAVDKNITISNIMLIKKTGGKSGTYRRSR